MQPRHPSAILSATSREYERTSCLRSILQCSQVESENHSNPLTEIALQLKVAVVYYLFRPVPTLCRARNPTIETRRTVQRRDEGRSVNSYGDRIRRAWRHKLTLSAGHTAEAGFTCGSFQKGSVVRLPLTGRVVREVGRVRFLRRRGKGPCHTRRRRCLSRSGPSECCDFVNPPEARSRLYA